MNQKTTDPHAGESFDQAVQRAADGAAKIITQLPEWATTEQIEYLMDTFDDAVKRLIRPRSATETEAFYEGHSAQYWYDQLSHANATNQALRNDLKEANDKTKRFFDTQEHMSRRLVKYQRAVNFCIGSLKEAGAE